MTIKNTLAMTLGQARTVATVGCRSRAMTASTPHRSAVAGLFAATMIAMTVAAQAVPMPAGGRTSQPIGHYEFCQNAPQECRRTGHAAPHALTEADWQRMVAINNRINTRIRPLTDLEIWGREEVWSFPTSVGDCEDYVLLKRQQLMEAGFHPSNLLITVVRQPNGDGHAVLTVRTDHGDFILDNMVGAIEDWRDTPYTYLKRQSTAHAGRWETIHDARTQISEMR